MDYYVDDKQIDLEILTKVSKIVSSTFDLDERLKLIVEITADILGTDGCNICLVDEESNNLILKAAKGFNEGVINKLRIKVGEGITGWVAQKKEVVALKDVFKDPRFLYIPDTGEERYQSMLAVPIEYSEECIGVLSVHNKDEREYSYKDIKLLKNISNQISWSIKNAQLFFKATQRLSSLILLHDIGQGLSSTLKLADLFNLIVRRSAEITNASGAILCLLANDKTTLTMEAYYGTFDKQHIKSHIKTGEGLIGRLINTGKPILLGKDYIKDDIDIVINTIPLASIAAIPLIYRSRCLGILCLINKKRDDSTYENFTNEDLQLLTILSSYASIAIDNAYVYDQVERLAKENEAKVRELSILYEISMAIQTTINLDKLLRIILGCVTVGGGCGFNRAIMLLVNEKTNILQGMMGLGPDNEIEAGIIWEQFCQKEIDLFNWLVQEEEKLDQKNSKFNKFAKGLRIPIINDGGILAQAILNKRAYNIKNAKEEQCLDKEFLANMGVDSFAVVPIIAQENVLGVIVVDNRYNKKPIIDGDIQFLTRVASHAGWAIQNARLFNKLEESNRRLTTMGDRLIQSERLASLGKLSAEVAHEIKNPLVSIGGFARRLNEKIQDNTPEKRYSAIIVKEVERLENLLKDILSYSKVKKPICTAHNINNIIDEVLSLYERDIKKNDIELVKRYDNNMPFSYFDHQQIIQIITNLLTNAIDSMNKGGVLTITTKYTKDKNEGIKFTISDTGGGIPLDVLDYIYNPFFTTKEAGTGLGLSLTRKIIENHGGSIELKNVIGEGATFTVILPNKPESKG